MPTHLSILLSLALVAVTPIVSYAGDVWDEADQKVVRLAPRAFSALPEEIITYMEKRRCLIPQAYDQQTPHNVIHGEFAIAGQTDVAVLCSVDRVSTTLVFWNMSADGVAQVGEPVADKDCLQGIGDDKIGFSCRLSAASPKTIRAYPKYPEDPDRPAPVHDGIKDTFVGKGAVIWYFHEGAWLRFEGGC